MSFEPKSIVLKNGLRIFWRKVRDIESVAVSVCVKVGSRFEDAKIAGISHFTEHMLFKGTKSRNVFQIAEEFDSMGDANAYTDRARTVYYAKILREDIGKCCGMLRDMVCDSIFPQEELDKERGVVLQEIMQTNDDPSDSVFDRYLEVAYGGQSLGHSILGYESTIKSMDRKTMVDFVSKNYVTGNAFVVITGNVEDDDIHNIAAPIFTHFNEGETVQCEQSSFTGGVYEEARETEQTNIVFGFKSVSYIHDDRYAVSVLGAVLGGGFSSRLFREIREKRGLAYAISAFNSFYSDSGVFSVFSSTSGDNVKELSEVIASELLKIRTDGIDGSELEKVKKKLRAGIAMSEEGAVSCSESIIASYCKHGRYISKDEILSHLERVTVDDVNRVAKAIFTVDKSCPMVLASIGKKKFSPDYNEFLSRLA